MEKLKLNIQLFGGSLAITAYETDVDINNNTSYVYVELKPSTNSTTYNENGTAYVQATLTGQNDTFTIPKTYFNIGKGKTVTAYSGKLGPFRHNADGSLNNVSISASCYIVSNTQPTATASVAMSTIPRASSISSITGDQIGSSVTVTISRASSSFTHKIQVIYGEKRTDWISFGSNTSATFTIPMDFCNSTYLQNTDNGQFIFWLSTESNGTSIGTTQTLKTMYVPSSVKPTISSVTKSDTANLVNTYGGYVQGKSNLRIQTSANGAYGSSISSCVVTIKDSNSNVLRTLNGTDVTVSNISYTGTLTIVSTVTDSRSRTATNTSTVSVLAYSSPVVEYFTAARVNGNEGTVKLTWKASITSLNSHNGKNFYVYYRQTGTSSWTQLTSKTDGYSWQNDNYTTTKDTTKSWEFKFECWDSFTVSSHIIKSASVNSAFKLVNYKADGTGIAFGKYSETSNMFEVDLDTKLKNATILNNATIGGTLGVTGNTTITGTTAFDNDITLNNGRLFKSSTGNTLLRTWGDGDAAISADGRTLYVGYANTTAINVLSGYVYISPYEFTTSLPIYTNKPSGAADNGKFVLLPRTSYSSIGSTTATDNYLQKLLVWICNTYPDKNDFCFVGPAHPNSEGSTYINIYSTSIKDGSTGLPQYSSGVYYELGGNIYTFGTLNYSYYCYVWLRPSSGTFTCTKSSGNGNVTAANYWYSGRTTQLEIIFNTSGGSTSVGGNVWKGTISGVQLPKGLMCGCAFYGSTCFIGALETNGTLTIRVIGATSAGNSDSRVMCMTYIS